MNAKAQDVIPAQQELPTIEKVKSIYGKLLVARQKFHEIKLVKTGHNTFSNYRYFELADFLPYAMNCTAEQGLIPVISFDTDYATMTVHDADSSDTITITSPMSTAKLKACHEVQNLGAVQTYERRYLWMALMEVLEGDPVETTKPASDLATPEQIANLFDYAETDLMTDGQKAWLEKAGDKITSEQAAYVLEKLHKLEAEQDD